MNDFISSCLHDEVDDIFWRKSTKFQRLLCTLFIQPLGYNPFDVPFTCDFLHHFNVINVSFLIMGVAVVFNGFEAPHKEAETYLFLYGTGSLHLDGKVQKVSAPAKVEIPGDVVHAMTPLTDFVILVYLFYQGPFDSIEYTYMGPKMFERMKTENDKEHECAHPSPQSISPLPLPSSNELGGTSPAPAAKSDVEMQQ